MREAIAILGLMMCLVAAGGCAGVATPNASQRPTATVAPTAPPAEAPAAGKVKLYYGGNAQAELLSPGGTRVLVDVYSPSALSAPASAADTLLTTHTHGDHLNRAWRNAFPGKQLFTEAGSLAQDDVSILGIAAAHNAGDVPQPSGGTDYIYLIEMGGLRIAHFGDIGQDALTPEQLAALGQVDIAIMQLDNSYSAMNVQNKKGFNLMAQVKPRLIIPTHNSQAAAELAGRTWPTLHSERPAVSIGPGDLTDGTRLLFLGANAAAYGKLTNAQAVDW